METYGATCLVSPSELTQSGRAILAQRPDHPGSLGIVISEAIELAAQRDDTKYALGSVLNHVLLHQTILGEEAILQLEMAGDDPDVRGAIEEAQRCRREGRAETILFKLCGHGHFDMAAYSDYFAGTLTDQDDDGAKLAMAMAMAMALVGLPSVPAGRMPPGRRDTSSAHRPAAGGQRQHSRLSISRVAPSRAAPSATSGTPAWRSMSLGGSRSARRRRLR
jgi:hypothetical protein